MIRKGNYGNPFNERDSDANVVAGDLYNNGSKGDVWFIAVRNGVAGDRATHCHSRIGLETFHILVGNELPSLKTQAEEIVGIVLSEDNPPIEIKKIIREESSLSEWSSELDLLNKIRELKKASCVVANLMRDFNQELS